MYLHVGEEITIKTKDIIAIIDQESAKASPLMDEFVNHRKGIVFNVAKGKFKSVVITLDKVYFSPFSSGTLKKRSQVLSQQE
jgi:extracellular matrix regulatory protein B